MNYCNSRIDVLKTFAKMSRHSTEEWHRRKRYLLRSLFDNMPLLSPIPEVQKLSSQLTRLENEIRRPFSPLPELITEKEPNRHDESEEYYEALKEKVKKIYKKLFLYKRLASVEEQSFIDLDGEIYQISDNENVDTDLRNSQLTDQDEVHSDEVFEQRSQEADSCHQSELLDQPEIMRSNNTTNRPKDFIKVLDHESDISVDFSEGAKNYFMTEIGTAEEFSLNLTGNVYTSTPTAEIEELQGNQQSRRRTLQTITLDEFIPSPKRIRSENLATQTSFSSSCEDSSWQEIKTSFFVGKQSVFNLCHCRNHICH